MNLIKKFFNDEEGQGLVEYALIVGLISIVAVVAIKAAGVSVGNLWNSVKNALSAY